MLNVDKIFITHYSPLKERKDRLLPIIQSFRNDYEFIEKEPTLHDISFMFDFDEYIWRRKIEAVYSGHHLFRVLKDSEISLIYKHMLALQSIRDNKIETALILEDDVVFDDDFENRFNQQLKQSPKDWDFIFPGSGCNLHIPDNHIVSGQTSYRKNHPASKCTDSMVVKLSAVDKILNTLETCTLPWDYELSYQFFINSLKVYWWEPTLAKQGSQIGLYGSKIQ